MSRRRAIVWPRLRAGGSVSGKLHVDVDVDVDEGHALGDPCRGRGKWHVWASPTTPAHASFRPDPTCHLAHGRQ